LGEGISLLHSRGWEGGARCLRCWKAGRGRDRRYRATQSGPHRGDIAVEVGGQPAKDRISRGQQKLVAAALMLAQLRVQEQERPGRSALLLDDPAAELDRENLARLMAAVRSIPAHIAAHVPRGTCARGLMHNTIAAYRAQPARPARAGGAPRWGRGWSRFSTESSTGVWLGKR
jgi:hypothetical protein